MPSSKLLLCTFFFLASTALASQPSVTGYTVYADTNELGGTEYGVHLLSEDEKIQATIPLELGDNTTLKAMEGVGEGNSNWKTVSVLLDEAGGGRCDACRTTVSSLVLTMMELVKKNGQFEQKKRDFVKNGNMNQVETNEEGNFVSVSVDPASATKAVSEMCTSPKFAQYAPYVMKGCVEFLSQKGSDMVQVMNGALQGEKYVELTNELCVDMLGACDRRPTMPKKISRCRSCAEVVSFIDFSLRRQNQVGLDETADPMSLNANKKKKDMSYMSRPYIQNKLQDLCGDAMQYDMMVATHSTAPLSEMCEELTSDYEDDLLNFFTKKKHGKDVGRDICVDVVEACDSGTAYDTEAKKVAMGLHVKGFGPNKITISANVNNEVYSKYSQISPRQKAMQLEKDKYAAPVTASKPRRTQQAAKTEAPPSYESSTKAKPADPKEALVEGLSDFIDRMEEQGKLSEVESEALLKKVYDADEALLRCYRVNRKKTESKLLARMKILVAAPTTTTTTTGSDDGDFSSEISALEQKMAKSGGLPGAEVKKLGKTLESLKKAMKGSGLDTANMDKLDSLLKSTDTMAESTRKAQKAKRKVGGGSGAVVEESGKKKKLSEAEAAAEGALEAMKMLNQGNTPDPDEL